MSNFVVVGDIEYNDDCFKDALECTTKFKNIVFLGDIYDPNYSSKTIKNINDILINLNIDIIELDIKNINDIKRYFKEVYLNKNLSIYNNVNKFINNNLKLSNFINSQIENNNAIYNNGIVFLFGNKEIDLIRDLTSFINGVFINNETIKISTVYYFKAKRNEVIRTFTKQELNILYTYLNLCKHFIISNKILITHMYINAKALINSEIRLIEIEKTISGHNRCFGIYYDVNLPLLDIHLLDITHEKKKLNLKNYLTIKNDNIDFVLTNNKNNIVNDILKYKICANDFFLKSNNEKLVNMDTVDYFESLKI